MKIKKMKVKKTKYIWFSTFALCLLPFAFSISLLLISCAAAQNYTIEAAQEELEQGKYAAAITSFNRLLQANPNDADAQKGLLQAYLETGQYAEAEREAKKFLGSTGRTGQTGQTNLLLGEVYAATGRYSEAIAEFEKAGNTTKAELKLRADLRRAEILKLTGKEDAATEIFNAIADFYDKNEPETAAELTTIAAAMTHLEKYHEANKVYLEAIDLDEAYINAHLGGGELYTAKYNYADAAKFLNDAAKINSNSPRLLLDIAANRRIDGGEKMNESLTEALKINPNYVDARILAATLDLEAERFPSASKHLDEALKINPNSPDAHALRAAMYWLQDRKSDFDNEVKAALAINPRYGMLYEVVANSATQVRRYSEAVGFLQEAIRLSPRLWSSHLALGIGMLRLGKMDEGRAELELAFKGDPFNIWAKNTLDLLDTMKDYRQTRRGDFIISTVAKETDVLSAYAADLLEEARGKLSAKYKFTPRPPISVEIFPNHADFEVRVLGLTGLGALGVCFGQVIAQDSPSARPGEFNWGSTLWHEYTHVITLQITDHMIPRWFSEGLSVFEEHNARPGWGDDWNTGLIKSLADGEWFKIADLDNGFIRPKRPNDVPLAYFEASQICQFITDRYGFNAILEMLRGYKEKKKTPEILQQVLKLSEADFDREFNSYARGKVEKYIKTLESGFKNRVSPQSPKEEIYSKAAASPDDFALNFRAGLLYYADKNEEKAIIHLRRSIELYPYQGGQANAYEPLAAIYEKRGDKAAAAEMLEGLIKIDEDNYEALQKLAQLKQELGDKARALEVLQLGFYVNPFEHAAHTMAGNLHLERNEGEAAVREFQVALAANPPNVAEAHYNIARAYLAAGKNTEAKRSVLRALEDAPGYDKAQELLLKLTNQ
jgi:tetratricopeptide (TPR) repeat protein